MMFCVNYLSLNGPLKQSLEILAVTVWVYIFTIGGLVNLILSVHLILKSKYCWIVGAYFWWIWIDSHTSETGGRQSRWVKSWSWWKYQRNYFPIRYEKLPEVQLDPKKNYLFCCFPHGMICNGMFNAFGSEDKKYFTQHTSHLVTLPMQFMLPLTREIILGVGGISSSATSINHVLNQPGGGHICVLAVGGAKEAYYSKPGSYKIELKNRRGFVKLALQNGAPLVPVISFGETDLYDQLEVPFAKGIQEIFRKWIRAVPIIVLGRFLLIPYKRPVTTVVGQPLDVPRIINPTKENIDEYHAKFVEKLTMMFEEQKYNYLEKPEEKKLIIE